MKNILKIAIIMSLGFSAFSCEPDISEFPEDKMRPEDYFKSETELELWTNKFYNQLSDAGEIVGQNADDNIDNYLGALMLGERDASNEDGWNWEKLRDINFYLAHSKNCQDQKIRNKYDGVAYFSRAYFYYKKLQKYGDIPLYSNVIDAKDKKALFMPRVERGIVMDTILADLDKAIKLLPVEHDPVRFTKWTALALKSRAALFEGTFRKYHNLPNADKYLNQAAQAGEEFINTSGYELYNQGEQPYRDLFNDKSKKRDLAQEIILWRVYSKEANVTNSVQFEIKNSRQSVTRRFMNHYLMSDGSKITQKPNWDKLQFIDEVKNRDPRLAQTILTPKHKEVAPNLFAQNNLSSLTGYQPIKYTGTSAYDGAGQDIINIPLFRAAEVYLNFAEAKAELGTITQDDIDKSIKKIRLRAKMPNLNLAKANSNPDELLESYYPNVKGSNLGIILEIRRERTVELVMEGFRQWDLLRWKEGAAFAKPFEGLYFPNLGEYDLNGDNKPDIILYQGDKAPEFEGKKLNVGKDIILSEGTKGYVLALSSIQKRWQENRDYLWPIPTDQRVETGGVLTQNPNWQDGLNF